MEQWSLIPNMVSLKQDITIQTQDCSLQVQDYKVMSIIETIFSTFLYSRTKSASCSKSNTSGPIIRVSTTQQGEQWAEATRGTREEVEWDCQACKSGNTKTRTFKAASTRTISEVGLFLFSYFICWSSDSDPSKLYLE